MEGQGHLLIGRSERCEAPGVEILVLQAEPVQPQLLGDPRVADHHVGTGAAVDPVAGEALDGRDGSAQHGVAFDDGDRQAGRGEVAGADQAVVAAADDDDVRHRPPAPAPPPW